MCNFRDKFKAVLLSLKENNSDSVEILNRTIIPNIPEKLFRFRGLSEYSINNFKDDVIYTCHAADFNDPYDCLTYYDFREIEAFHMKHLKNITAEDIKQKLQFQLAYIRTQFREDVTSFACFTENVRNTLMWAHYADYHKGFALEYDFKGFPINIEIRNENGESTNGLGLYPEIYSDERYDGSNLFKFLIAPWCEDKDEIVKNYRDDFFWQKFYLHKSLEWSYEQEWRLINNDTTFEKRGTREINYKPTAIYYGVNIEANKQIFNQLREYAKSKNMKEYQMYLKEDLRKHEFDYIPI